jgi:hypothetical protein
MAQVAATMTVSLDERSVYLLEHLIHEIRMLREHIARDPSLARWSADYEAIAAIPAAIFRGLAEREDAEWTKPTEADTPLHVASHPETD